MLKETIVFLILMICSIQDIKTKRIQIWWLLLCLIPAALLWMMGKELEAWEIFGGIAVGAVLLVVSRCTKEAIGYGDGLIFIVTGVYLGMWENLRLLFTSLIFALLFSVVEVIARKKSTKDEIAFIPFVWIAQTVQMGGLWIETIFEKNL